MDDWAKVLIGALAGLLVGAVSEPMKTWIQAKQKERTVRNALHPLIAEVCWFLLSADDRSLRAKYPAISLDAILETFEHYYATEKGAFFRLKGAHSIRTFFFLVRKYRESCPDFREEDARSILACVTNAVRRRALKGRQFKRIASRAIEGYNHSQAAARTEELPKNVGETPNS